MALAFLDLRDHLGFLALPLGRDVLERRADLLLVHLVAVHAALGLHDVRAGLGVRSAAASAPATAMATTTVLMRLSSMYEKRLGLYNASRPGRLTAGARCAPLEEAILRDQVADVRLVVLERELAGDDARGRC